IAAVTTPMRQTNTFIEQNKSLKKVMEPSDQPTSSSNITKDAIPRSRSFSEKTSKRPGINLNPFNFATNEDTTRIQHRNATNMPISQSGQLTNMFNTQPGTVLGPSGRKRRYNTVQNGSHFCIFSKSNKFRAGVRLGGAINSSIFPSSSTMASPSANAVQFHPGVSAFVNSNILQSVPQYQGRAPIIDQ
ncbi:hypothetical protein PENTCL1PPCAC_7641, partial [Pristionchus entomophagus]